MVTSVQHRFRQALLLIALGALVLGLAYLLAVQTRVGQAWGDEAYLARVVEGRRLLSLERFLLESITIPVLLCFGLLLVLIGGLRRRWLATALVTGAYAAAIASAEVLKAALSRPELATAYESLMGSKEALNTYPSGHATLATGLALGAVILASPRQRPYVAILGSLLAVAVSCAVVAAGWHRPSDAIGGIALALTWMAAAAAITLARRGTPAPASRVTGLVLVADVLIVASVVATVIFVWIDGRQDRVPSIVSGAAFPTLVSLIAIWAAIAVGLVVMVLRDVDIAPSARLTEPARSPVGP
ncbi:MAG TPA: hypothetical protein DCQ36_04095 [Actinobacteria bacterium]|jgi:membrane-associated phospholipid phosphatase|nr:hypothetical protein [Actinomycetota bacterium]